MNPIHAIAIIIGGIILLTFYLTMIGLYINRNRLGKQKTAEPLSPLEGWSWGSNAKLHGITQDEYIKKAYELKQRQYELSDESNFQ